MEMNLSHQFWAAKGSLVRSYEDLRLVYEVESKMRDLRKAEEMQQARPQQQEQQAVPVNPSGNGHKNGGKLEPATKIPHEGLLWGTPEMARIESGEDRQKTEQDIRKTEKEEGAGIGAFCERVFV
jgi:hypothetical protein